MKKPATPEDNGAAIDVMMEMIAVNTEFTKDVAETLGEEVDSERNGSIKTLTVSLMHMKLLARVIADIATLNPDSNCGRMISNPEPATDIMLNGIPSSLDRELGARWLKTTLLRAKAIVGSREETT